MMKQKRDKMVKTFEIKNTFLMSVGRYSSPKLIFYEKPLQVSYSTRYQIINTKSVAVFSVFFFPKLRFVPSNNSSQVPKSVHSSQASICSILKTLQFVPISKKRHFVPKVNSSHFEETTLRPNY